MKKTQIIDVNGLNPYVRAVGLQLDMWPDRDRRLYDHELFYCHSGKATITINNTIIPLKKGTLAIIPPNTKSRFWFDIKSRPEIYWMHFDPIYIDNDSRIANIIYSYPSPLYQRNLDAPELIKPIIIFSNGYTFPDHLSLRNPDEAYNLMTSLNSIYCKQEPYWQLECKNLCLQLLHLILRQTYSQERTLNSKLNVVNAILHYIESNYNKPLTLDEIANYVDLSKDYCNKIFKAHTGDTIITHLNSLRFQKAKELLIYSQLPISHIAEIVGYSSPNYFSRLMQEKEKLAPKEYRETYASVIHYTS